METLAQQLSRQTLERIVDQLGLEEVHDADQATNQEKPFLALISPAFGDAEVGTMRCWAGARTGVGEKIGKVVYVGMTVPPIGLDSHMIFAFPWHEVAGLVPSFTLDAVCTRTPEDGEQYAFHLDLIPKCDLGVNLAYLRRVYEPLSEARQQLLAADGTWEARLSTTQWAIMSPWMLARRSTPEAFRAQVYPAVDAYLSHWLGLLEQGVEDVAGTIVGVSGAGRWADSPGARQMQNPLPRYCRDRERVSRELIFNRELDPVWSKVDRLLGRPTSDRMLEMLCDPGRL